MNSRKHWRPGRPWLDATSTVAYIYSLAVGSARQNVIGLERTLKEGFLKDRILQIDKNEYSGVYGCLKR